MGSHGGATAEGQRAVIESYGITEDFVSAPIRTSMEVVLLGDTPEGWPVYLDKNASTADHIGVVARIKPHTSYNGPVESGLLKMMMIGLGKRPAPLTHWDGTANERSYFSARGPSVKPQTSGAVFRNSTIEMRSLPDFFPCTRGQLNIAQAGARFRRAK